MSSQRPLRLLSACLLALLLADAGGAAQPSLEVRLQPERLGLEDLGFLTVIVRDGAPAHAPQLQLDNLQLISGPSTERQFSWVNGRSSSAVVINWVVQPVAIGTARVGAIQVEVDGVALTSEAVAVEVVPGSLAPPRRHSGLSRHPIEELLARRAGQSVRVVLRTLVETRGVVLGETLPVTVVLDTTADVDGFEWVTPPTFPGWWAQAVDLPERPTGEVVEVEGVRYRRFPIAQWVLIPLAAGERQLPSASARVGVRPGTVFAPPQVLERTTEPVTIRVAERPAAPDGFTGAVGSLRYSARLEPAEAQVGEPLVLTVQLEGRGNLPLVDPPPPPAVGAGVEVYPPEEESSVEAVGAVLRGRRTWRTTVLPRVAGPLELPAFPVAVFEPAQGRYRTTQLGPLHATILPPPVTPTPLAVPAAPVPTAEAAAPAASGDGRIAWGWLAAALGVGLLAGGLATWLVAARGRRRIPPAERQQGPAERARQLQVVLDEWWRELPEERRAADLRQEVEGLRRALEGVRFAPARADHSGTVEDLESRLKLILRRA